MADYEIGDMFVDKTEKSVTAIITDKRVMNGITHYLLTIHPSRYKNQSGWISEYGILINFEPMGRFGKVMRKPKNPITAFLKWVLSSS